jgi:hypothetical protein
VKRECRVGTIDPPLVFDRRIRHRLLSEHYIPPTTWQYYRRIRCRAHCMRNRPGTE